MAERTPPPPDPPRDPPSDSPADPGDGHGEEGPPKIIEAAIAELENPTDETDEG